MSAAVGSAARDPVAHRIHLLTEMLRVRRFEERCVELYSDMHIRGFLHLAIGEEACAVGMMEALTPEDHVVATYREHGHALARGISMRSTMAELFGRVEGCSRGRGGSRRPPSPRITGRATATAAAGSWPRSISCCKNRRSYE